MEALRRERRGALLVRVKKRKSQMEGRRGGKKMVETEASSEVKDEKGEILFSFHVVKYLLCLHIKSN